MSSRIKTANHSTGSDTCDASCINAELVEQFGKRAISHEDADDLAGIFQVMGDPTRLRLI
jgi:hypothetical protein